MKILPQRDYLLIRRRRESVSAGGIHIPDKAEKYRVYAEAVGPDVVGVQVGDELLVDVGCRGVGVPEQDDLALIREEAVAAVRREETQLSLPGIS